MTRSNIYGSIALARHKHRVILFFSFCHLIIIYFCFFPLPLPRIQFSFRSFIITHFVTKYCDIMTSFKCFPPPTPLFIFDFFCCSFNFTMSVPVHSTVPSWLATSFQNKKKSCIKKKWWLAHYCSFCFLANALCFVRKNLLGPPSIKHTLLAICCRVNYLTLETKGKETAS